MLGISGLDCDYLVSGVGETTHVLTEAVDGRTNYLPASMTSNIFPPLLYPKEKLSGPGTATVLKKPVVPVKSCGSFKEQYLIAGPVASWPARGDE